MPPGAPPATPLPLPPRLLLLPLQGPGHLFLLHPSAHLRTEPLRPAHQLLLRRAPHIDPGEALSAGPRPSARGARVGRALLALRLPVVTHLLEGVLQGGVGGAMGAAP